MVSRQFVEMNRLRVEGLLAAFPKLIGTGKTQHTFIETDTVRYVYQPLENQIYLLLITTKASNIVEDLGTLRLLAKVVPDVAGGLMEHAIHEHAFDLLFAFDEVLTAGGYKDEGTTLPAIRTNLLMDSHEEKIFLALKESKETQAKETMRQQAKTIQERHLQQMRQNFVQGGGGGGTTSSSGMPGFGGGGYNSNNAGGVNIFDMNAQFEQQNNPYASSMPAAHNPYDQLYGAGTAPTAEAPKVLAKSGMKLGGAAGGKKDSLMAAMAAEDNLFPLPKAGGAAKLGGGAFDLGSAVPQKAAVLPSTPVSLALEEKISVTMNREGAVESCDVKGTLTVTANTEAGVMSLVTVNKAQLPTDTFTFATHPKVDKKAYEQKGVLSLKGDKGFPVGRPVGILRWSYGGDDAAPLTINCWPEHEGAGTMLVNIEMELTRSDVTLSDVNIVVPLGTTEAPVVNEMDGVYKHDPRNGMMCWHFDRVDAQTHPTASLEFRIAGSDTDAFFPVQIGFSSETLLCPVAVLSVTHAASGAPIPSQTTNSFVPETYQCA